MRWWSTIYPAAMAVATFSDFEIIANIYKVWKVWKTKVRWIYDIVSCDVYFFFFLQSEKHQHGVKEVGVQRRPIWSGVWSGNEADAGNGDKRLPTIFCYHRHHHHHHYLHHVIHVLHTRFMLSFRCQVLALKQNERFVCLADGFSLGF